VINFRHNKRMRHIIFLLLVLLITSSTKAQYYLIHDNEGSVNVRETAGTDGKIICPLKNGTVVLQSWSDDTAHKNWVFVEFYLPKNEAPKERSKPEEEEPVAKTMKGYLLFSGYIYRDRLINIEQSMAFKSKWAGDEYFLYNDSVKIKFSSASFQKQKHKIGKEDGFVTKIDGHFFAGTDGDLPRREIKTFSVEINHYQIDIPKSCFYDLYEPNLNDFANAYMDKDGTLYIIMYNSDAAGSYSVIFVIKDGKYFARYVFEGEC
jgi:hypothetical protein